MNIINKENHYLYVSKFVITECDIIIQCHADILIVPVFILLHSHYECQCKKVIAINKLRDLRLILFRAVYSA